MKYIWLLGIGANGILLAFSLWLWAVWENPNWLGIGAYFALMGAACTVGLRNRRGVEA